MSAQLPRWYGDFEIERQHARAVERHAREERDHRAELLADAVSAGRLLSATVRSALIDTSELSPNDLATLRRQAREFCIHLAAVENALRYIDGART
jgi:hypothetical protein